MPTCRDMAELVTDFLERKVAPAARVDMWWHLIRCRACRHYYDQMRRTVRLLGAGVETPPDDLTVKRVMESARGDRNRDG